MRFSGIRCRAASSCGALMPGDDVVLDGRPRARPTARRARRRPGSSSRGAPGRPTRGSRPSSRSSASALDDVGVGVDPRRVPVAHPAVVCRRRRVGVRRSARVGDLHDAVGVVCGDEGVAHRLPCGDEVGVGRRPGRRRGRRRPCRGRGPPRRSPARGRPCRSPMTRIRLIIDAAPRPVCAARRDVDVDVLLDGVGEDLEHPLAPLGEAGRIRRRPPLGTRPPRRPGQPGPAEVVALEGAVPHRAPDRPDVPAVEEGLRCRRSAATAIRGQPSRDAVVDLVGGVDRVTRPRADRPCRAPCSRRSRPASGSRPEPGTTPTRPSTSSSISCASIW